MLVLSVMIKNVIIALNNLDMDLLLILYLKIFFGKNTFSGHIFSVNIIIIAINF